MIEQDTRDRVIRLETEVKELNNRQMKMSNKVDEMHSVLLQARGAKWAVLAAAGIAGFLSAKIVPVIQYIQKLVG